MLRDRVKQSLRVSHSKLDDEIDNFITTARSEMVRAGVVMKFGESELAENILINDAIITFCLHKMASQGNEKYFDSFQYQCDCLRKSTGFKAGEGNV